MSRYIDIEPYEKDGWYLQKRYHNSYGEVIKTTPLVSVPTAEVEPRKRGRWETPIGYPNVLLCSECATPYEKKEFVAIPNYCPNCGADMRESRNDNHTECE